MPDQVTDALKKARSQALHGLGERLKYVWLQQQLGQTVPVLWEYGRVSDDGQRIYTGYTPNYCKVRVSVADNVLLENTIRQTLLTGVDDDAVLCGSLSDAH